MPRQRIAWRSMRTPTLTLVGLGCLTAAAWIVHIALGLLVLGVCCLVVEYLADGEVRP